MIANPMTAWLNFVTSPAAPKAEGSPVAAGIGRPSDRHHRCTASDADQPSRWIAGLWATRSRYSMTKRRSIDQFRPARGDGPATMPSSTTSIAA